MNWFVTVSLRRLLRHWKFGAAVLLMMIGGGEWHVLHAASARGGRNPEITWYVPTQQKVVALTFDDGPWKSSTPAILRILVQHHALATFFVIGQQVLRDPAIIRQETRDHMEIGNHTFSHINLVRHSYRQDLEDMAEASQAITQAAGQPPSLLRTPYGTYNQDVLRAARTLHLHVVMWSWTEDTRDWSNPGVETIVTRVVSHIQPGDIVLFHDGGSDRTETIQALPIILRDLSLRGYRFVTVSALMKMH